MDYDTVVIVKTYSFVYTRHLGCYHDTETGWAFPTRSNDATALTGDKGGCRGRRCPLSRCGEVGARPTRATAQLALPSDGKSLR